MNTATFGQSTASVWSRASEEFACDHSETTILTVLVASNGVRHYRRQCTYCGENVGSVKALDVPRGSETTLPPFDKSIRDRWVDAIRARSEVIRAQDKEAFDSWYRGEYLRSPEWRRKRAKVLKRANGVCEGCGDRPPVDVHHLTYTHVGREFLFQLAAVCRECHEQIHAAQEQSE